MLTGGGSGTGDKIGSDDLFAKKMAEENQSKLLQQREEEERINRIADEEYARKLQEEIDLNLAKEYQDGNNNSQQFN